MAPRRRFGHSGSHTPGNGIDLTAKPRPWAKLREGRMAASPPGEGINVSALPPSSAKWPQGCGSVAYFRVWAGRGFRTRELCPYLMGTLGSVPDGRRYGRRPWTLQGYLSYKLQEKRVDHRHLCDRRWRDGPKPPGGPAADGRRERRGRINPRISERLGTCVETLSR